MDDKREQARIETTDPSLALIVHRLVEASVPRRSISSARTPAARPARTATTI
jgi:hypothetical protein